MIFSFKVKRHKKLNVCVSKKKKKTKEVCVKSLVRRFCTHKSKCEKIVAFSLVRFFSYYNDISTRSDIEASSCHRNQAAL